MRLLDQYVPCDSWVALLFSADQYLQKVLHRPGEDGGPDQLVSRTTCAGCTCSTRFTSPAANNVGTGLSPVGGGAGAFELTEYYQRYFRVNVVADEIQFNCQLEGDRTLCLSLGSKQRRRSGRLSCCR